MPGNQGQCRYAGDAKRALMGAFLFQAPAIVAKDAWADSLGDITHSRHLQDADQPSGENICLCPHTRGKGTEAYVFHLARNIDLQGTDIHSDAFGNAPGGIVIMRAQEQVSFTDTNISVDDARFRYRWHKPNGEPARYQGFSRIDIMAQDIVLKDSTIAADANVSDIGSCPLCNGGPERRERSGCGSEFIDRRQFVHHQHEQRASPSRHHEDHQGHYFSYGGHLGHRISLIYPPIRSDSRIPKSQSRLNTTGFPGYLRIRADDIVLDHSMRQFHR